MGVSWNRGTPKSSILVGFSLTKTNHFGYPHDELETSICSIPPVWAAKSWSSFKKSPECFPNHFQSFSTKDFAGNGNPILSGHLHLLPASHLERGCYGLTSWKTDFAGAVFIQIWRTGWILSKLMVAQDSQNHVAIHVPPISSIAQGRSWGVASTMAEG